MTEPKGSIKSLHYAEVVCPHCGAMNSTDPLTAEVQSGDKFLADRYDEYMGEMGNTFMSFDEFCEWYKELAA